MDSRCSPRPAATSRWCASASTPSSPPSPASCRRRRRRSCLAGRKETVALAALHRRGADAVRRRWANALPWSVLAAGAVVAAAGGILHWQAAESYNALRQRRRARAAPPAPPAAARPTRRWPARSRPATACRPPPTRSTRVGAAGVVAGGVLAYLNRAKPYRVDEPDRVAWAPLRRAVGAAGVSATVHF